MEDKIKALIEKYEGDLEDLTLQVFEAARINDIHLMYDIGTQKNLNKQFISDLKQLLTK